MEANRERTLVGLFVLIAGALFLGTMVVISGVPYVSELIARNLARDLRVFSLAAVCIFVGQGILGVLWGLMAATTACDGATVVPCRRVGNVRLRRES